MSPSEREISMTSEELEQICVERYGEWGWKSALSREIGASLRVINYWAVDGVLRKSTAMAIRALKGTPVPEGVIPLKGAAARRGAAKERQQMEEALDPGQRAKGMDRQGDEPEI
jgi:hypothetical protein